MKYPMATTDSGTRMTDAKSELRCPGGHKHGEVSGRFIERHCRQCSNAAGRPVYHVWDSATWTMLPERGITTVPARTSSHAARDN